MTSSCFCSWSNSVFFIIYKPHLCNDWTLGHHAWKAQLLHLHEVICAHHLRFCVCSFLKENM